MPVVTLDKLIKKTRVMSGLSLTGEDAFDDDDIITALNDASQELDDTFAASNSHWRRKTYDFTLTNDPDLNYIDLADIAPDFQITQGVDWLGSAPNPRNVPRLGSFVERNRVCSPHYFEDGTRLYIFGRNAAGPYRLHYTPQTTVFAPAIIRTFDIAAADTNPPAGPGDGPGFWVFANGAFNTLQPGGLYTTDIPVDGTAYVVTDFDAGPPDNTSFNGTWFINAVSESSANIIGVTVAPSGNVTGPAAGTATLTYQPIGTISELPVLMNQWAMFLKLHASISIRESQELEVTDLERKFAIQQLRVKTMSKKRTDGIVQPGLTQNYYRNRYGIGGWSY